MPKPGDCAERGCTEGWALVARWFGGLVEGQGLRVPIWSSGFSIGRASGEKN